MIGHKKMIRFETPNVVRRSVVDSLAKTVELRAELDANRRPLSSSTAPAFTNRLQAGLQHFSESFYKVFGGRHKKIRATFGELVPGLHNEVFHIVFDQASVVMDSKKLLCNLSRIGLEALMIGAFVVHRQSKCLIRGSRCPALIMQ